MADKQIYDLDSLATDPTVDDLLIIQDDPAGARQTRKITVGILFDTMRGRWGSPTEISILSGVAALDGPGYYYLLSESGFTDSVTQFTGLDVGDEVIIEVGTGHTITLASGTYIKGASFTFNSVYDCAKLQCVDTNTVRFTGRENNG